VGYNRYLGGRTLAVSGWGQKISASYHGGRLGSSLYEIPPRLAGKGILRLAFHDNNSLL
jgi:hypothetical protein